MPDDKTYPANPPPYIAQRESDRQTMLGALKAVEARASGMAHVTASREIAKHKPGDMPYMTHTRKRVMAGRRHPDQPTDLNAGLNQGSTHLQMPAEPHGPTHRKEMPAEGQVTLPKDQ